MSFLRSEVNQILEKIKIAKAENSKKQLDAAFNELFTLTYQPLRKRAKGYVIHIQDARAAVITAYEKVFAYLKSYNPEQDGFNWLCRIVQRCAYTINKQYAYDVPLEEIAETVPDESFSIFDYLEKKELRAAIRQLAPEQRKLIDYYYFKNCTMEKLTKIFHIAKATVFYRLRQAEENLRKILKKD